MQRVSSSIENLFSPKWLWAFSSPHLRREMGVKAKLLYEQPKKQKVKKNFSGLRQGVLCGSNIVFWSGCSDLLGIAYSRRERACVGVLKFRREKRFWKKLFSNSSSIFLCFLGKNMENWICWGKNIKCWDKGSFDCSNLSYCLGGNIYILT